MRVEIGVPATSANLGPGFDVLALALDLENRIEVEAQDALAVLTAPGSASDGLAVDDNAVVRAWRRCCADLGAGDGARIVADDRIPLRRGLGSSAAASLAGVLAARVLHRAPWDDTEVLRRVSELEGHPDNAAAALLGGLAVCVPGGPVTRLDVPADLGAVVFVPELEMPTAEARAVVPRVLPRADAVFNASRCALLVRAMATRDWETLAVAMEDRWHQPPRAALFPAFPELVAAALAAGARGAALSGAGSTVLALTDRAHDDIAAAMRATAERLGVAGMAMQLAVRNTGARVEVR